MKTKSTYFCGPASLSDSELIRSLQSSVSNERKISVTVLDQLNEIERRSLHLEYGYGSLYSYCTIHLDYSEGAACRRIQCARAIRKFPEVRKRLEKGELNLTTLSLLAGVLNQENKDFLIRQSLGRSKREVERVVARYRPRQADVADRITPITVLDSSEESQEGQKAKHDFENHRHQERRDNSNLGKVEIPFAGEPEPFFAVRDRFMFEFSVSPEFMRKFERVRTILSGTFPRGANFEQVFERVLDSYISRYCPQKRAERREARKKEQREKQRKRQREGQREGQREKQRKRQREGQRERQREKNTEEQRKRQGQARRKRPRSRDPRHLPMPIRDQILARDRFRCTYRGPDNKRCDCDWDLEVHHIVPVGQGGSDSFDNLTTMCVAHNMLMAEKDYGKEFMQQFRAN